MLKQVIVFGIAVLVVSTSAWAISQNTQFDQTIENTVWRPPGGPGRVGAINGTFVGLSQDGTVGRRGYAEQNAMALLGQRAVVWGGRRSESGVAQSASTSGNQLQRINRSGPRPSLDQVQQSSTAMGQTLNKVGGRGGAAGVNVGIVHLDQNLGSRVGLGEQSLTTGIIQGGLFQGGVSGSIQQNAGVNAEQYQGSTTRGQMGSQSQTTWIVQGAMVQGGPGSRGYVTQDATVNTLQSQNF